MVPSGQGFVPESGHIERRLRQLPQFHDPNEESLTLPLSQFGYRVGYRVVELPPALDSSDMMPADWMRVARAVQTHYDEFDAFVILHGTDTMAYTASALSFLLEGLGKTVILTGSQVPLSHAFNDAVSNLLGALTLAGHYDIPEVCVYFGHALYRGNRVQKVDASGFGAFDSANLAPLATVGAQIEVAWDRVLPVQTGPIRILGTPSGNVACLRLFPGIRVELLQSVLRAPTEGLVLETYGSGNAPTNRPELLAALREAAERGVVVVSCTQCFRGGVVATYAGGRALAQVGVIAGGDMTPEAALTKLAVLLGQNRTRADVQRLLQVDLRGELTAPRSQIRFSFRERTFVQTVARMLTAFESVDEPGLVEDALYPVLMGSAARLGDVAAIDRLLAQGVHVDVADYDGRTALHVAASAGQATVVRALLRRGARSDLVDAWGNTAREDAHRQGHAEVLAILDGLAAGSRP